MRFRACALWLVFLAVGCSDPAGGRKDTGAAGLDGTDGEVPVDGQEGSDGTGDGTSTADGTDGSADSADGTDGTDGTDGSDALADAEDGSDAPADGSEGSDASGDGSDGSDGGCPQGCAANEECVQGVCALVMVCEPGKKFCQGLTAVKACNEDGTGFLEPVQCPDELYCSSGKCGSKCTVDPKLGAYIGCSFWTVDLPNYPDPTINPTPENSPHAVVVSNPGELDAEVSFHPPDGVTIAVPDPIVKAKSSSVFVLPIMNVQKTGLFDLGVRLESSRPVLVHQFNPWDNKYSNDASLLLPANVLGTDYVVLSWLSSPTTFIEGQTGYFTVVATRDATEVTLQVSAPVKANGIIPKLSPGQLHTVEMAEGQVLNIETEGESLFDAGSADLSGSRVWANYPIAVFSGHEEAVIGPADAPSDVNGCCADHLEEQLLPTNLLGAHYLAIKTKPRGTEIDLWRIQAADANVVLSTNPPQKTVDGDLVTNLTLSQKGAYIEIQTSASFEVTATGPVQVMQYLVSQGYTDDFIGDPSLIGAVPVERFRTYYVLSAPPLKGGFLEPAFGQNWVTLVKETDAPVLVAGTAVPESEFKSVSGSPWRYAYVDLSVGVSTFESTAPFGLSAYGYNSAVSYGYPGGLQIDTLVEP